MDWDTRDQPDPEPAAGLRHAREVEQHDQLLPEHFLPRDLLDPTGLRERAGLTETASSDIGEAGDSEHSSGEHGSHAKRTPLMPCASTTPTSPQVVSTSPAKPLCPAICGVS